MNRYLGFDRLGLGLARRLLNIWVRPKVLPDDPRSLQIDSQTLVCYALEMRSLADLLVLERETRKAGLHRPTSELQRGALHSVRSVFAVARMRGWLLKRAEPQVPELLRQIAVAVLEDKSLDVQLLPVSIFWGRAPEKETSSFKALFAERWRPNGRLMKLLTILLHGRAVLLQLGKPLSVRACLQGETDKDTAARKLARLLRVHFKGVRTATIGPDLSHRNTLVGQLLEAPMVSQQIEREARARKVGAQEIRHEARDYALEIAADYSPGFVRFAERLLSWLWNRLYNGIAVHQIDNLLALSKTHTIVYAPCHRSHIDYLLLSYVVYQHGLAPPHIAAGLNLNLPLLGGVLRRGGAFFLRRSFKGNKLYAEVFHEYLRANIAKGVSIEYFIEGGRSRTGRLMRPKPGMLSMTLRSFVGNAKRPLAFVPVYIGYDRLVEGRSYIGELSGKPKRKENWLDFLRAFNILRSEFGTVQLAFGEPIEAAALLDNEAPGWREAEAGDSKPAWLASTVSALGDELMVRINQAAVVNSVNLLALALLAVPRQAMAENDLVRQVEMIQTLVATIRASQLDAGPIIAGRDIIAEGEELGLLMRREHELGAVLSLAPEQAVLSTYFRNNILHLVALPSLIACAFLHNESLEKGQLTDLCRMAYPYIRSELFLPTGDESLAQQLSRCLQVMQDLGLLKQAEDRLVRAPATSREAGQLSVLAQATLQILERYYLVIALLCNRGSGILSQRDLESLCQLMAQRISMIYEMDSPDFFARDLFSNFINELRKSEVVTVNQSGKLEFGEILIEVSEKARHVLSEEIRHSILRVTQA